MKKISFFISLFLSVACIHAQTTYTYTGKPMYKIDVVRGSTFLGSIHVELFPTVAPHHVRNFDSLVSVHFYDTTAFHRVIPGFMIQGGDPNSRHGPQSTWGQGQPSQPTVNAEFTAAKHIRGTLSAARSSNINSATSQFFICVAPEPSLNGQYSAYGRVISGMNWVDTIVNAPRNSNDCPLVKHEMFVTAIGSNDTIPGAPQLLSPANGTTGVPFDSQLLLKWKAASDGIIYTYQLSEDSTFSTLLSTTPTGNNSYYISSGLQMTKKYFWRVNVNNGGHISTWSPTWSFYTAIDATGIATNSKASASISVYPNPGNSHFTFSNLPEGSRLQVFDVAGKLIYDTLVKDNTVRVNLEGKEKGIYFYKVRNGDRQVAEGKLILQ